MKLFTLGKIAGVLTLTAMLAGCIDMTMDLDIQSETNGKSTVTMVMAKDIYAMVKAGAGSADQPADGGFCKDEGAVLTENADGSATCVQVQEGNLADLMKDDKESGATFTVVSPGVVRVALKTSDMKADLSAGTGGEGQSAEEAEQTKAMMTAFFEGHTLTLRFHGKEIVESNMDISGDKTSAEKVIPFLDLINGTTTLPDELYAVVKTN